MSNLPPNQQPQVVAAAPARRVVSPRSWLTLALAIVGLVLCVLAIVHNAWDHSARLELEIGAASLALAIIAGFIPTTL